MPRYAGRWVKDCDKDIQHELKDRGLLVHAEPYRHDYPFCWRADTDPLIQYARPAWYIRTTALKDRAIANNRAVHWLPEHIKEGRFGDFLAQQRRLGALARALVGNAAQRLDLRRRDARAHGRAGERRRDRNAKSASFRTLSRARGACDPTLSEHLIVHKPWIDQVTFPCAKCARHDAARPRGNRLLVRFGVHAVRPVGIPARGREQFERTFPADFISEAIDQTRGWFYSLLMISTLVFDSEAR